MTAAVATVDTSVIFTLETHDCDGSDKTCIVPFAAQSSSIISCKQPAPRPKTGRYFCDCN